MPKFSTTIRKELTSTIAVLSILAGASFYLCIVVLLTNYRILISSLFSSYLFSLLTSLFFGVWTGMTRVDFVLLLVTAILFGVNIYLTIKTIYILENKGKVRLSIGGATIVSLITTGCASCGLSVLSVLGLSTSIAVLPFHGMELHIASLVLLIASSVYMLNQIHQSKYCRVR